MIRVPREVCVDLDQALSKEWLVSNGIGGYASGTVTGVNTRRYHGLLVASLEPPVARTVLLSNIDEEAEIGGRTFYLGANEYPDSKIHPGGFVHIAAFSIEAGVVTTRFRLGNSVLHKSIWMENGHNTTYIRYTYVEGEGECCLALHTMCNYRDYHEITRGNLDWNFNVQTVEGGCRIEARTGATPFWLTTSPAAEFTHTGVWYWNFVYRREVERGFPEREDLYLPGVFRAVLQPGESVTLIAATEPPEATAALMKGALAREHARQQGLLKQANFKNSGAELGDPTTSIAAFAAQLVTSADQFM
ncbi:MAG: glycogen debranching enzyme N-terminal domain-containing protein, partial [Chloroflexota bacterium]|nr:glycogen debranching enzyme N-terminal domain-containing protein [Chloroflexota bacterium]